MVPNLSKISGINDFTSKTAKDIKTGKKRELFFKNERPFLVVNQNTIELRCDQKLANLLKEKYESVMESRYFGQGGIEIVLAGQLSAGELDDLIRLSYDLTIS